ncbi:hypothetical protein ACJX0J_023655, partial [Zea mays]
TSNIYRSLIAFRENYVIKENIVIELQQIHFSLENYSLDASLLRGTYFMFATLYSVFHIKKRSAMFYGHCHKELLKKQNCIVNLVIYNKIFLAQLTTAKEFLTCMYADLETFTSMSDETFSDFATDCNVWDAIHLVLQDTQILAPLLSS